MQKLTHSQAINATRFVWRDQTDRDAALRALAIESGRKPALRIFTSEILARHAVPERNNVAKAEALRRWFRKNVPYQMEAGEQIVKPELTLSRPELGYDCDDQSLALAAMLVSVGAGADTRFNYWSNRPNGNPNHVSVGVRTNSGVWVNVDPIYNHASGWTPDGHYLIPGKPIGGALAEMSGAVVAVCPPVLWPMAIGAAAALLVVALLRRK